MLVVRHVAFSHMARRWQVKLFSQAFSVLIGTSELESWLATLATGAFAKMHVCSIRAIHVPASSCGKHLV